MKYILISLMILLPLFLFAQKKINEKDIYFSHKSLYLYKEKPLNGTYKVKFSNPNSNFSEIATYKNGVKEGRAQKLRFDKLEEEGYYFNNKKEGIWKKFFFKDSRLEKVTRYEKGIKQGLELEYGLFSSVDSLYYVDGVLDGIQINTHKYKGRTETLYNNGTIISSVMYNTKGWLEEVCDYISPNGEEKRCVRYKYINTKDDEAIIIDSIYINHHVATLKRYQGNKIQYGIRIQKTSEENKDFITYYDKDKRVAIVEINSGNNSLFNTASLLELINSQIQYNGFNYIHGYDFMCTAFLFIFDDQSLTYIYRLQEDGTFSKYKGKEISGSGDDMLPGCTEELIEKNAEIPKIKY